MLKIHKDNIENESSATLAMARMGKAKNLEFTLSSQSQSYNTSKPNELKVTGETPIASRLKSFSSTRHKSVTTPGLTLRKPNSSISKTQGHIQTVVSKKTRTHKSPKEDEIECMPQCDYEPDNYEDIIPVEERPSKDFIRRVFCLVDTTQSDSEDDINEEVIQWPSIPCKCPFDVFSPDPEYVTEEFANCPLDDIVFDSDC